MPRGQKDYGVYQAFELIAGLADIGEAAARLGSINVYDRRGWTMWMDSFEAPKLSWNVAYNPGGSAPVLDSTFALMGAQSCKLACSAAANSYCRISRGWSLLALGKAGAEFAIQGDTGADGYLELIIDICDGVNESKATLRYNTTDGEIKIYTPSGWVTVATGIYMVVNSYYFVPIKLVIDIDEDKYVRLRVAEQSIDLSNYALEVVGTTTNKIITISLDLRGEAAGITTAYIDNFIFTQVEP